VLAGDVPLLTREPVARELAGLLGSEDALLVAAAAVALGAPGSKAAVTPLAKLLGSEDACVRGAAIRGLGGVATPGAREALAKAAASHPDAATRRRAGAEVKRIDRSARASQAPTP
jgi:HEAT repeat protein